MTTDIFTVCDSGQDYGGKLVIVGTFDTIFSKDVPVVHPSLSIVGRLRFSNKELRKYNIVIEIQDNTNKKIHGIAGELEIKQAPQRTSAANIVLTFNEISFPSFGEYSVVLKLNEDIIASTPLYIVKRN